MSDVSDLRIGLGIDAHAFGEGVPLVLGGVMIDHPRGLVGHSDGDVVAHALADALLGAAGLADIGALFPSDDARYRGADSLALLAEAYRNVRGAGLELVNADCIVIGQEPQSGAAPRSDAGAPRRRPRGGGGADQRPRHDDRSAGVHGPRRGPGRAGGRPASDGVSAVEHAHASKEYAQRDLPFDWKGFHGADSTGLA